MATDREPTAWQPDALINEAATRLGTEPHYVEWYSWPTVFGSTAGPGRGVGGQAITAFQVLAFREVGTLEGLKWCAGHWQKWNGAMEEPWRG